MPGDPTPAAMEFTAPDTWNLSGHWTALGIGDLVTRLRDPGADSGHAPGAGGPVIDGARVEALDSVGAMLIERWVARLAPAPAGDDRAAGGAGEPPPAAE